MNSLSTLRFGFLFALLLPIILLGLSSEIDNPYSNVMMEICDNGVDDDGDGLIDLNDEECLCEIIEPKSLIPNPSFEDQDCCPSNRSELNCADVWIQASGPTTDYIHTCGYMGWDDFPPPTPFPDGDGIMGFRDGRVIREGTPETNWKEYAGACLLSPLLAGTAYRFEFDVGFVDREKSPAINISFFGSTDCSNLPFGNGDDAFGCPTNGPGWTRLGATRIGSGTDVWLKGSIDITPDEDIYAIVIGPDCPAVRSNISIYYFFDNLLLDDFESFELKIDEIQHPCSEGFTLEILDKPGFEYQWYKDGIALSGETKARLGKNYGEGDYQVRILSDGSCRLSGVYNYVIPEFRISENKIMCLDDTYAFGDIILDESGTYIDTLTSVNECDSIVTLELLELGLLADTIGVKIFEGETYKIGNFEIKDQGDQLVTLTSNLGCDSLVLVQLDFYNIFIPNIFNPTNDDVNSLFSVFSDGISVESYEFQIFDIWGNKIFQGQTWDGTYNNHLLKNGLYSYRLDIIMDDGIARQFYGNLTLLE